MNKKIKNIILTIDYEIHFGSKTGSVYDCMIYPTKKLIELCKQYNSKMTVFWDILHYYKLLQYEEKYPELLEDRYLIDKQIQELVSYGHDVQLHIHPHWLDAKYEDSKWKFKYNRFNLQSLSKNDDKNDINTIRGCVKISKELMENTIRKTKPSYKVKSFRAGGYLIEPFNEISAILRDNNILIDSSVCPNLYNENSLFSYNFKDYPDIFKYKFNESPSKIDNKGIFTELPIKTIYISIGRNLFFLILKRTKYKNLEKNRKGTGAGQTTESTNKNKIKSKLGKIIKPHYNQLTSDSCFKEKYNFLLRKSNNNSVQILHPKLLNDHMVAVMEMNLQKNRVRFISINDFMSKN